MEITLQTFLIVCPFVFLAGCVDAIAGGGGLISLPAYFLAGVPPHMAIATNKLSSSIGTLTASEIGAHDAQFGPEAALTKRVGIATPPQRQSGVKIREKDAAEAVRQAMELLAEAKLI